MMSDLDGLDRKEVTVMYGMDDRQIISGHAFALGLAADCLVCDRGNWTIKDRITRSPCGWLNMWLVEPGSLSRFEGKVRRVVDKRVL
jgi:hypothetical protein